jgi:hypothetical protein
MRKLFPILLLLAALLISWSSLCAQSREETDDPPGKFFISPDIGLVFGTVTRIEFSPSLGYHITPGLVVGTGGRYEYYREKDFFNQLMDIQTNIYGYRFFTRLTILKSIDDFIPINIPIGIFGHAEYESLSLEERYFRVGQPNSDKRFWLNSILAGGGISQRTGARTYFNIIILWDLTNSASSPYVNPIMKFGLQFYL